MKSYNPAHSEKLRQITQKLRDAQKHLNDMREAQDDAELAADYAKERRIEATRKVGILESELLRLREEQ